MKITRRQLSEIIGRTLEEESTNLLFEIRADVQIIKNALGDLEGETLNQAEVAILLKGIEQFIESGSDKFVKALADSPKATAIMVKSVPSLGSWTAGAIGLFGSFTIVSGVFSILPSMISRTLDNLSSVEGSFLNFYKIKNVSAIRTGKKQEPIKWSEYGDSTGAAAEITKNMGIKIRTKKELAMILAASKMTGNRDDDIMAKIEKAGQRKFDGEGYERIFDVSFYKAIGKVVKKLRASDGRQVPAKVFKEIADAVQYKDKQKLSAFADMFSALV